MSGAVAENLGAGPCGGDISECAGRRGPGDVQLDHSFRLVVDESSFDWRTLADAEVEVLLEEFIAVLRELRHEPVALPPIFYDFECREGLDLMTAAFGSSSPLDRDLRNRFITRLDRCGKWDASIPGLPTDVVLDGAPEQTAYSIGYALHHVANGFGVACVVFGTPTRRGSLPVEATGLHGRVHFFNAPAEIIGFWRTLFDLESIPEDGFWPVAAKAFPDLVFADGLAFRKFEGAYEELRSWVVRVLSVFNDFFADALREASGQSDHVISLLKQYGVESSPESPKTHKNTRAMHERRVLHEGEEYFCEWHAKYRSYGVNRIHFSLPDERLAGRILVGIFAKHLTL